MHSFFIIFDGSFKIISAPSASKIISVVASSVIEEPESISAITGVVKVLFVLLYYKLHHENTKCLYYYENYIVHNKTKVHIQREYSYSLNKQE